MATKKQFNMDSAAAAYLSQAQEPATVTDPAEDERERKTVRKSIIARKSIIDDVNKIAWMQHCSFNDAVDKALELYRDTYKDQVTQYDNIFKGE